MASTTLIGEPRSTDGQAKRPGQLAARAGVSNKTIVGLENGHGVPIFRTIGRISAALDVPPGEVAEFAAAIAARGGVTDDAQYANPTAGD